MPPELAAGGNLFPHRYSIGAELAPAYQLTGVLSVHADLAISVPAGVACQVPFDERANPVYLTQWVTMNPENNQIEIGTGHQCNGFVYHFWGYRYYDPATMREVWEPLGTQVTSPNSDGRYYDIHRLTENGFNYWHYFIQGVERYPILYWDTVGYYVDAGLETSDTRSVVSNHWFSILNKTVNEGPWQPWGAYTTQLVNHSSLASFWRSSNQWSAAQNSPCY